MHEFTIPFSILCILQHKYIYRSIGNKINFTYINDLLSNNHAWACVYT